MLIIIFNNGFEENISTINLWARGRGQAPVQISNHDPVLEKQHIWVPV